MTAREEKFVYTVRNESNVEQASLKLFNVLK